MRRTAGAVLVLALAAGAAACGGDDGGGAGLSAADQEYVDALVASAVNDEDRPEDLSRDDVECVGRVIVDHYDAQAFEDAGLSVDDVREPGASLDALPAPSPREATEMGEAIQECEVGDVFAALFAEEFGAASSEKCLADALDTDPRAAAFLGVAMIDSDPSRDQARALVGVMADCIDLGEMTVSRMGLPLATDEEDCVAGEAQDSEDVRDLLAQSMSGSAPTDAQSLAAFGPIFEECLTPARLAELGLVG
jgi:hypothetical protein